MGDMERIVHGVNVGGCCLGMVTGAVELASSGGVMTAASGVLSALALRRTPRAQTEIAERMVAALDAHLALAQLTEAVERQVVQVLDGFAPAPADIAHGDVDVGKIAEQMRARVPAEAIDAEHREAVVLDAYSTLLEAVLTPLCVLHRRRMATVFYDPEKARDASNKPPSPKVRACSLRE